MGFMVPLPQDIQSANIQSDQEACKVEQY